jgi:hypothetical protein
MIFFIFFVSIILWVLILHFYTDIKKITAFNVFFLFFIVYDYLGFIYLEYTDYFLISYGNLSHQKVLFRQLFYINTILMWLIIILYTLIKNIKIYKSNTFSFINYKYLKHLKNQNIFLFIICIIVLSIYLLNVGLDNLSIYKVLTGASLEDILISRNNSGNNVSKYHWYKLFFKDFLFLSFIVFYYIQIFSKTLMNRVYLFSAFILLLFTTLMTGEKSTLLDLVLLIFIMIILLKHKGYFNLLSFLIFIFFCIISIFFTYSVFMPSDSIYTLFSGIFERLTVGQLIPGVYYLKIFPDHYNYLYGQSFPNPMGLMNYKPIELTVMVMDYSGYNITGDKLGIVGTMPFCFWGEMYANFGYLGIFVSILIVVFIFSIVDKVVLYFNKSNFWWTAFYIYLIVHLKDLAVSGLFGFIFDLNIFVILIFILFFKLNLKSK